MDASCSKDRRAEFVAHYGQIGGCSKDRRAELFVRCGQIDKAARRDRAEDPYADDTSDFSGAASGTAAESDGDAAAANNNVAPIPFPALVRVLLAALEAEHGDAGPASIQTMGGRKSHA